MTTDQPRCPECGESAEFEACSACRGVCVSDLTKPCIACFGYGGRYFCEFCSGIERKSEANKIGTQNEK